MATWIITNPSSTRASGPPSSGAQVSFTPPRQPRQTYRRRTRTGQQQYAAASQPRSQLPTFIVTQITQSLWSHTYSCPHPDRTWLDYSMNYKDQAQIERMILNSNVVINLLGPRHKIKKREDFEFINIEVPERIAKACAKHGIHRLIHFSAAGAAADSPSLDFQTKYEGEDVVRKAFPNVTILRPCPVFGLNDNLASIIRGQINFFWNKFVPVYDDCSTKKQPIRENDVAKCVLNALKL